MRRRPPPADRLRHYTHIAQITGDGYRLNYRTRLQSGRPP
jgi:hypothetical protein